MIPTLYKANETSFKTNGLGIISEILEDKTHTIEKTIDGAETGSFSISRSNRLFKVIKAGMLVKVDSDKTQPDDIYQVVDTEIASSDSSLTVRLQQWTASASNFVLLKDISVDGKTAGQVLQEVTQNLDRSCPFLFSSDLPKVISDTDVTYSHVSPNSVMMGDSNSLMNLTGGHIYRYRNSIRLGELSTKKIYLKRGKNIAGINIKRSLENLVTRVIPYFTTGKDSDKQTIYGATVVSPYESNYGDNGATIAVDYSDRLSYLDKISENENKGKDKTDADKARIASELLAKKKAELQNLANKYFSEHQGIDIPKYTVTVDVSDYGSKRIQKISIGDTAVVYDPKYDLTVNLTICQIEYDFTVGEYTKITAGDPPVNLWTAVQKQIDVANDEQQEHIDEAIDQQQDHIDDALDEQQNHLNEVVQHQQDSIDEVNGKAETAIASADGKSTNYYGDQEPDDKLGKNGDTYFQYGLNRNEATVIWVKENGHWIKQLVDGKDEKARQDITNNFEKQEQKIADAVIRTTTISKEVDKTNQRVATLQTGYDGLLATVTNNQNSTSSRISQLSDLIQTKVDSSQAHSIASMEAGKVQLSVETDYYGRSYIALNGGRIFVGGDLLTIDANTKFSNGVIANQIKAGDIDAGKIAAGTMRGVDLIGSQHITLDNGSSNVDISPWGMTLTGSSPHIQIGSGYQHGNLKVFGDANITDNLAVDGQIIYLFNRNSYLRVDPQTGYLYFHGGPGWYHNYKIALTEV